MDGEKRMSTLGTLQDMMNEMKSGVYDFTKDGECSNCGACCSDFLPMSNGEVKAIRKYIAKHGIKEHKHTPPTVEPVQDFTCPFRNELERKCDIYQVRPAICRDFRCDKPRKEIMANKNMYHGKYSVWEMRETFFGKEREGCG